MAEMNESFIEKMIDECEEMMRKSYCAYSDFPVGAVLVTECGKTFTGCNVENSSYGLSICAERTAAVKAVSEGFRKFKACFVMTKLMDRASPCGACRQFLSEFGRDMSIYIIAKDRTYKTYKINDLLPLAFDGDCLSEAKGQEH